MVKQIQAGKRFTWQQLCCTLFFAVIPFVYSAKGVDPVLLPRHGYVSAGVVFMAGLFLVRLKKHFSVTSVLPLLMVLLGVLYVVSIGSALNTVESFYICIKISVFVAFFWVMYCGFREQFFTIKSVSLGIALSGIAAAGLAIRDMLFLQSQGVELFSGNNLYKVNATFGHKNLLSSYLFVCLPMLIIQWVYAQKQWQKWMITLASLVVFVVIVLLQTRAVLIAVAGCSVIGLVMMVTNRKFSAVGKKGVLVVVIGSALLMLFLGYMFREKFATITRTESFIERAHVWENTRQMISDNPFTGVGAANWQIEFPKYGMQKFYEVNYMVTEGLTNFQRPHNDFLWVWAETGTPGFVVYALIFLLGCLYAVKGYRREQDGNRRFVLSMLILQVIGFVFISLVDFPLERIEHPVVVFTSIAYVAALCPSRGINMQLSKWVWIVWFGVGVYALYICKQRWQSELHLRKVYKAHASGNWQKLVSEAKQAQTSYFNQDYFSIPVSWYIGVGYFKQNNLPQAKQYFEEAYALHPYQVHVLNNYGACFEKEGNHTRAIELLETANRISPSFSDGIINLSGAYFNAGRYDDAYRTIGTIGYDDTNERLKTFILAIVKKKITLTAEQNVGTVYATSLEKLRTNDAAVLVCFKNARTEHIDFMEYLNNRLKDSPENTKLK